MVEHVYRRAASAVRTTSVLVATDDQRVYDAVTAFGGNVRLTERHYRNGTERLGEVAHDLTSDLVVNLQADEPLVDPASIDLALSAFDGDPKLNMATLRTPITDPDDIGDPHVVKVVVDLNDFALYFSRSAIPHIGLADDSADIGRPGPTHPTSKHIGLYVYRRDFVLRLATLSPTPLEQMERLEQLRALEHGYRIKVLETAHDPIGVDTPEDLERVRRIVAAGASQ